MSENQECPRCSHKLTTTLEERGSDFCPQCRFPVLVLAGKYKLVRELAEGGFGRIYEAVHIGLPHMPKRAIKFIKPEVFEKPGAARRFDREVRVTSMLAQASPHVVQIYDDIGDVPNLGHFYVMEFLEGELLSEYATARGGTLTFSEALGIMTQLCHALQVSHEAGVVHRDLKPDNIFLLPRPNGEHLLKVIDFGIAKPLAWPTQSITKGVIGTPLYMSPEQCMGKKVGPPTDIYAMGVLLFELLVGYTPYGPKNAAEAAVCTPLQIIFGHLENDVPKLTTVMPGTTFPDGLQEVLECAMYKQVEGRFPTVEAFEQALLDVAGLAALDDAPPTHATVQESGSQATLVEPLVMFEPTPEVPEVPPIATVSETPAVSDTPEASKPHGLPTGGDLEPVEVMQTSPANLLYGDTGESSQDNLHPTMPQQLHDYGYTEIPRAAKSRWPWALGALVVVIAILVGVWVSRSFVTFPTKSRARLARKAPRPPHRRVRRVPPKRRVISPLRRLPECPKAPFRWTFLAISGKGLAHLHIHHKGGKGMHKKKKVGVCVGILVKDSSLRLDGSGIIPCTIKPWHLAPRVPIFLQFEGGGLEPSSPDYCLKPKE